MVKIDSLPVKFFLILNFLSLLLFLYISFEVLSGGFAHFDEGALGTIYSLRNPILTQIMYFASFLGGEFTLLASAVIVVFLIFKKYKKEAVLFAITVVTGYLLNSVLKLLLKVPRPDIDPISYDGFYSFPSGHAMNSLIFYGLLSYFIFHFTRKRGLSILVSVFSIIIILLIGFSRLYLGVHYPSDILAGFIAGFWWLVTAIVIFKTWEFYKLKKRRQK